MHIYVPCKIKSVDLLQVLVSTYGYEFWKSKDYNGYFFTFSEQVYNQNVGIELTPDATEICVIRAVAVAPGVAASEIFTSRLVCALLITTWRG